MTGIGGLEKVHDYLVEAFPRLRTGADAAAFRLSDEQVESFARDGFVAGLRILDADQVTELARRVDHIRDELPRYAPHLYEVRNPGHGVVNLTALEQSRATAASIRSTIHADVTVVQT